MLYARSVRVLVILAVFLPSHLFSQEYRARIQGLITDPNSAAIAGAKVTLRNSQTGVSTEKTSEDNGTYRFDFVLPGTYTISVESPGFTRSIREGISVQTAGDITVDVQLTVGNVNDSVTVEAGIAAVEFTTATMTTTVNGELLKDVPVLARNPFTLALLDPAVVNRYWDVSHRNPFYMWSSNGLDVGGSTGGKNDMLLDGVPLGYAARGGYNAPMDAVQEVAVQQNAIDAEYGFSAGGILNLSMKSGTNSFHGTAYYFGRNPALNAMTNRINRSTSVVRNHIWGAAVGGPIIKNKLFFHSSYEQWRSTQPQNTIVTLPTELERAGNFSQSLRPDGTVRPIFDPTTTVMNNGIASRQPFAGNIIPQSRIDPTGQKLINDLWNPNNPGNDLTGIDNFRTTYSWWLKYWNISERADWNISDKLRFYGRFSKYETRLDNPNYGGTIAVRSDNGGLMDALNSAADLLYMVSPNTTINFRYGATYMEDDYDSQWAKVPESVWGNLFPTGWYKPVLDVLPGIYYPNFQFAGNGSVSSGMGGWWIVHGRVHAPSMSVSHNRGMHSMKFGVQLRHTYDANGSPGPGSFSFNAIDTANTFQNPDLRNNGNMFASALLGVVNSGSANINPLWNNSYQQWGAYFHDDVRLSRRVTLNLGVRWELETAPRDDNYMFSRYLDLKNPIPEFQANPPRIPGEVANIANIPYQWNGYWNFTNPTNPRVYPTLWNLLPRAGIAIRLTDTSALRIGWSRYAVPLKGTWAEGGGIPKPGYSESTGVQGFIEGRPRTYISDPFPASNPLRTPVGDGYGRYTNLGNSVSWFSQSVRRPINDRFNVSYQRMVPGKIVTDTTFFMNFGHNAVPANMWGGIQAQQLNMRNPDLTYTYGAALDAQVDNPFHNILPPEKFPGNLRNPEKVTVGSLLVPFPQYGSLTELLAPGWSNRYWAIQFKAQRAFSNGLSFTFGFNYNRETRSEWFNDIDQYANRFSMINSRDPSTNIRIAGTYQLPFGRGRKFGNNAHPVLDAVIGGWTTSHMYMFNNGPLLTFGGMLASGDPRIDSPTLDRWFDTSKFERLPAYTPRLNPWYYSGLRGPGMWNIDSTLSKYFTITEQTKIEFRMEFYNMTNTFMPGGISTDVNSSNFGRSTTMANYGREIQYTARFHF